MTGPDPAENKPARSTTSRTKKADGTAEVPGTQPEADAGALDAALAPVEGGSVGEAVGGSAVAAAPVAAPAPEPVAEPVVVAAPAPAPVIEPPTVTAPAVPPAGPGAPPAAPPEAAQPAAAAAPAAGAVPAEPGSPKLSTPDIAGAVDKAVDRLRTHLTVGEIVAGLGAVIILGVSWLTFGFIFGHGGTWPSDIVMLLCVALLGALVLQNARIHDFGPSYRVIIAGICFALGLLALLSFLREFRPLFSGGSFDIGGLTWWAGAWVAVIGGLLVWRDDR